jgi:hypothetical protein
VINQKQNDDPLAIVQKYCELSEKGNYEEIKNLTTSYPEEYFVAFDKSVNLYKQSKGETVVEEKKEEQSKNGGFELRGKKKVNLEDFTTINEAVPQRINSDSLFISEIKNVWIKDNEARVRVGFSSRKSVKYRGEEDFLLYKKDGQWKIFMVDIPPLFPVYGMPDQ